MLRLLIICLAFTPYSFIQIKIDTRRAIHVVDERFASVTVDTGIMSRHWSKFEPRFEKVYNERFDTFEIYLRNRSAPAVNCWVIIHCLEVSCKEDQITSAQREWFIFPQLTDKQWIITQQFTQWSWSISILTHNERRKHIRSLQLLPTFRHCTEELPPIFRLCRIHLHVIVTSFKRKNDVTPSNAMNDVIFQWRQLSHTFAVNYCPIYHSLLPLAL